MLPPSLKRFLPVIALLALSAGSPAPALEIKGKADVTYEKGLFRSGPDAELRQKGARAAKENALRQYTAQFSAAKLALYQAAERDILADLDRYVIDATPLDEVLNTKSQTYSIVIRATINEAALNARLNQGAAASAVTSGSIFSFVFVARETESVREFQARITQITSNETDVTASQEGAAGGGVATVAESSKSLTNVTTGGSSLRKANEVKYRVSSGSDIDAAMGEILTSSGFDVVGYSDVVSACGGTDPTTIREEFSASDELSPPTRKGAIDGARACDVRFFALGSLDVGLHDIDPVSGNSRVTVSVRGEVWDISSKLPRKVASVGPVQYAGLGPDPVVAGRNALILAAGQGAKAITDQLNAKGLR